MVTELSAFAKARESREINTFEYSQLLSDYHHTIECHLSEFGSICHKMKAKNALCANNINKCEIFIRNNRIRETEMNYERNKYLQLIDTIHSYFAHSIDIGFEIIANIDCDTHCETENENGNIYFDSELKLLRNYLETKRENLKNFRGKQRMENNKFVTNVSHCIDSEQKTNKNEFSFGNRFEYWESWGLNPKYASMKEELVSNTIYSLSVSVFENILQKAMDFLNYSIKIKGIKCEYFRSETEYKLKKGSKLSLNQVLSVLLYTDFDTLSSHFSLTFRNNKNESNIEYNRASGKNPFIII